MTLDAHARTTLLAAALHAIKQALNKDEPAFVSENPDPVLRERHASFVTLKRHHALRGCIGTLQAWRPLLDDVIHNARAAAFQDPRFPPLVAAELENLGIEISVLSTAELIRAGNRAALLRSLRPGADGLIVRDGTRQATFLPAVWESLPEPDQFCDQLMRKAGLGTAHWSSALKFFRYHTCSFSNEEPT
ncbi:MAG: AmmeMemoRadiSam system protein A [Gammaproteobacteria bacterium]